jgi:glycosyltransferase involved in cell wall biosynthesis
MLAGASALHLTTNAEADLTRDVVPHVPRAIVPYPIDYGAHQELGSSERFRERFLPGCSGPVVMHLGRVAEKKGIDILIRAFRSVRTSVPDAQLVVVGPDDERLTPKLLSLARDLAIEDALTFTGMVRGTTRRDALAAADVWVLASHTENFGIAVIEALAASRPVVMSSKVNCADEIGRAGAARIVEPSWPAVAAAVGELLGDARQRAVLGGRGRRFAARFTREAVALQARGMYEAVLRNGCVARSGEASR